MGSKITVKTFRRFDEIDAVRWTWRAWQERPSADVDLYCKAPTWDATIVRPQITALYRDGCPDAILVGTVRKKRLGVKVGFWSGLTLDATVLEFDDGAMLGNPSKENCEVFVDEILASLRRGEEDAAQLAGLSIDSPLYKLALGKPRFIERDHLPLFQTRWSATILNGIESIYRRLPSKHRSELRRKIRKFSADYSGRITVECFRQAVDIEKMVRDAEEIAKKTHQRALGGGFMDRPWVRSVLRARAERDRMCGFILYIDDSPCAFWLGFLYSGVFHGEYAAYDRAYRKYSPGTFLTMKAIEYFRRRSGDASVSAIDFGTGDFWYKEQFCDRRVEQASLYIFAPSFAGLWLNMVRTTFAAFDRFGRRVAARTHALSVIRRMRRTLIAANPDGTIDSVGKHAAL